MKKLSLKNFHTIKAYKINPSHNISRHCVPRSRILISHFLFSKYSKTGESQDIKLVEPFPFISVLFRKPYEIFVFFWKKN